MKGIDHHAEVRGPGQVESGQSLKIIPYVWGAKNTFLSVTD